MGTVGQSGGKIPGMVPRWLILRLGIVKARAIRTLPNRNQGVHKACTFAHSDLARRNCTTLNWVFRSNESCGRKTESEEEQI